MPELVCLEIMVGGRYHFTSVSPMKSNTRQLKLRRIVMFSVLHLWFGHTCSKKSGWRKISFNFSLSYEIKDKTIEFEENRNVLRASFVVRAYMQGGRFLDRWGSCERQEKRFLKPNHDIPSTTETSKMIAEYKAQRKKSDDRDQLPKPVERKQTLTAERVLSVLKRISDEDCLLLGLNPKYACLDWMILQVLPIPPPHVRPSVMMDTSSRSEVSLYFNFFFGFMGAFTLWNFIDWCSGILEVKSNL